MKWIYNIWQQNCFILSSKRTLPQYNNNYGSNSTNNKDGDDTNQYPSAAPISQTLGGNASKKRERKTHSVERREEGGQLEIPTWARRGRINIGRGAPCSRFLFAPAVTRLRWRCKQGSTLPRSLHPPTLPPKHTLRHATLPASVFLSGWLSGGDTVHTWISYEPNASLSFKKALLFTVSVCTFFSLATFHVSYLLNILMVYVSFSFGNVSLFSRRSLVFLSLIYVYMYFNFFGALAFTSFLISYFIWSPLSYLLLKFLRLHSWFHDYITNRSQCTIYDGHKTSNRNISPGVPQESFRACILPDY